MFSVSGQPSQNAGRRVVPVTAESRYGRWKWHQTVKLSLGKCLTRKMVWCRLHW